MIKRKVILSLTMGSSSITFYMRDCGGSTFFYDIWEYLKSVVPACFKVQESFITRLKHVSIFCISFRDSDS